MLFARIGGILIILFGLYQLGIFGTSRIMGKEHRLPLRLEKMTMSPVTALIMGFTFSFAWTPCVGPALTSVLLMAGSVVWMLTAPFGGLTNLPRYIGVLLFLSALYELAARTVWKQAQWREAY